MSVMVVPLFFNLGETFLSVLKGKKKSKKILVDTIGLLCPNCTLKNSVSNNQNGKIIIGIRNNAKPPGISHEQNIFIQRNQTKQMFPSKPVDNHPERGKHLQTRNDQQGGGGTKGDKQNCKTKKFALEGFGVYMLKCESQKLLGMSKITFHKFVHEATTLRGRLSLHGYAQIGQRLKTIQLQQQLSFRDILDVAPVVQQVQPVQSVPQARIQVG